MTLLEYVETVENANKLAQRAGISPSVVYRVLHGGDVRLSTARKIVDASRGVIDINSMMIKK